ncbi:MAG: hypothetical protein R3Y10_02990 [Ferrimonas sp.]
MALQLARPAEMGTLRAMNVGACALSPQRPLESVNMHGMKALLVGFILVAWSQPSAAVEHLSVNRISTDNGHNIVHFNVVGQAQEKRSLRFFLQQPAQSQPRVLSYMADGEFALQLPIYETLQLGAVILASSNEHVTDDALGRFVLTPPNEGFAQVVPVVPLATEPAHAPLDVMQGTLDGAQPTAMLPSYTPVQVSVSAIPTHATAVLPTVVSGPAQKEPMVSPSKMDMTPELAALSDCSVRADETLWRAAMRLAPQLELAQWGAVMALYDANVGHFNGGPNRLRARNLRCPSLSEGLAYQDENTAKVRFFQLSQ